jgi:(p)ppGpp synthase/HD superfamily hydrolase
MHDGQKYGGANQDQQIEYLNHIGSVTFEVMTAVMTEKNLNANLAVKCAILHDTLEDTDLTYNDILDKFGVNIADGVLALTKNENLSSKREKMEDSLKRIKEQPFEIWAVKMADRISNLQQPPFYWDTTKKKEYIEEARLIHSQLHTASKYLADRLAKKIEEYQRFI